MLRKDVNHAGDGLAEAARACPEDWREVGNPGVALIEEILAITAAYPGISGGQLRERWRETEQAAVVAQLSDSRLLAHIPPAGRCDELMGALGALSRQARKDRRQRLLLGSAKEAGAPSRIRTTEVTTGAPVEASGAQVEEGATLGGGTAPIAP